MSAAAPRVFGVVVRSGSLHRNVLCAPVDFADVGDEVEVAVGADLEFGTILERKARR